MSGKGDKRRPVNEDSYRDNYDRIFNGKKVCKRKLEIKTDSKTLKHDNPKSLQSDYLESLQSDLKFCQELIDKARLSDDPSKDVDLDKYYRIQNAILEEIEKVKNDSI